ncbi:MAG: guanylate kinase [Dehalococcoidia bacterium]
MTRSSRGPRAPSIPAKPLLLVLSGPSGAGKDAVLSRLREKGYPLHYTVTATTRPQRVGEKEGVDYYFLPAVRFQEMVNGGDLLEWAKVYGHWYGVPREPVEQALRGGQDVIIKADVQGAKTIRSRHPQAVLIFLTAPTDEELTVRLRRRHTESPSDLARRLETAREEMKHLPMFDYVVVNHEDRVDVAVGQIQAIITAEKCRVNPRVVEPGDVTR